MKKLSLMLLALTVSLVVGCEETQSVREQQLGDQEKIMEKAYASEPTYQQNNFLARKTVNKVMQRMDKPNKLFYMYLLGDNGNIFGYYVAQYRPICYSTLLTPPEVVHGFDNRIALQAPTLDGTYTGKGCGEKFFFDAETDAYIAISPTMKYFVSDQPLALNVEKLSFK